jgi:YggT family protein
MAESVLARFILTIAVILNGLLNTYWWIVIIAVLLTWVNPDPRNPIVRFLYAVTEPVLYWIRRRFPFLVIGGFDLSPIVLLVGIQFAKLFLVGSLTELAAASRCRGAAVPCRLIPATGSVPLPTAAS